MKRLTMLFLSLCCSTLFSFADPVVEDGVYSVSCQQVNGYVALGVNHSVNPYICYVQDGSELTEDAYWVVTYTDGGYTFQNEASGEYLVFTYDRVDAYYKYMTLSSEFPEDGSGYWNIIQNDDGSLCIRSTMDSSYYWNLRAKEWLLGTYAGSERSANERYYLTKKSDSSGSDPDPNPQPVADTSFPAALHVFLSDGRIEAYPLSIVTSHTEENGLLTIVTKIGETFTYAQDDVDHVSEEAPTDFPTFESFKFNNKFNDQLFTDALGEMVEDTVFVTIAAIGKRLTPSFKLPESDTEIQVYVDGQRQDSKVSRLRFDKDIYYVVTRPGITMLLPDDEKGTTYSMQPYGRMIRVHVDWLTDRAEVPIIYINTENGLDITSKDYYLNAEISIDGRGIFPSMENTDVQIKGRGNSSWGWSKKPYRLKFEEKMKPLGMKKGKSWVLLSNGQEGSLMANAIGMKAANLMEASAANHIVPVDLYLNGAYRGSYNLTEKVGLSNNSVELEDDTAAALLELDSYYDEPEGQKFRSQPYDLPINVKEPDFSEDETSITLEMVEAAFNQFAQTVYDGGDFSEHVDIEQLVRFLMVNELICNFELYHPKSTFCYRESFEADTSKFVFGPVWDLDWAFGYEKSRSYFQSDVTSNYWMDMPFNEVRDFMQDLRFKYEPLSNLYQELWEKFMEEDLTELLEYCQDYYDFAHVSFENNRSVWSDYTNYQWQVQQAAEWLETRANQIYNDIINDVRPGKEEEISFDNYKLYTITCQRGAMVLNASHTGLDIGQNRWNAPWEDRLFAILNIEGKYYIYSPTTGKFLDCKDNGQWVDQLGSEIIFDSSHPTSGYPLMMKGYTGGNWLYFNNSTKELVINNWETPDEGNRWLIEPVEDFDPIDALALASQDLYTITYNYVFEDQIIHSETMQVTPGNRVPDPSIESNWFYGIIPTDEVPETVKEDLTINCDVNWFGPFEFTHSLEDAHWYNMTIRSDYYVGKNGSSYYTPEWVDEETRNLPEYQWAFGGDPLHVKVYNRSTGLDETLSRVGENAVMRSGDYTWDLMTNYYYGDGFLLRQRNTEFTCINQIGGAGGKLGFWNDQKSLTDNGSTFRVEEVPDIILLGDANGDGKVSITDAVYVVNYVLQQPTADFCEEAADLNGDGNITITDAVMIVNIILGQGQNVKAQQLLLEPQ